MQGIIYISNRRLRSKKLAGGHSEGNQGNRRKKQFNWSQESGGPNRSYNHNTYVRKELKQ